jgi:hypothetical protein
MHRKRRSTTAPRPRMSASPPDHRRAPRPSPSSADSDRFDWRPEVELVLGQPRTLDDILGSCWTVKR